MAITAPMNLRDLAKVCHTDDPDTSWVAAQLAHSGGKVGQLCTAILGLLEEDGPLTAKEVHRQYSTLQPSIEGWPAADLQDIRRRLTDLKKQFHLVADSGDRRNGEAAMRLVDGLTL